MACGPLSRPGASTVRRRPADRPKGTLSHVRLGWIWVALLATVALSSFGIHTDSYRLWRSWSRIHLVSILTPALLVVGVIAARGHRVRAHAVTMISIFTGALVTAGVFTFVPGWIMHADVFGR